MGQMRHVIQIMRASSADDGFSSVPVFAPHGDPLLARKLDASDAERQRADQVSGYVVSRFQVHRTAFTAGILPADRLRFEGRDYEITGIKDLGEGWQVREITTTVKVDQ